MVENSSPVRSGAASYSSRRHSLVESSSRRSSVVAIGVFCLAVRYTALGGLWRGDVEDERGAARVPHGELVRERLAHRGNQRPLLAKRELDQRTIRCEP